MTDCIVFITLGYGREFGISDSSMFIRKMGRNSDDQTKTIDLGPPTKENFDRLLKNLECLRCHLKE